MTSRAKHKTTSVEHSSWSMVVSFALIVVYLVGAFQTSTVHNLVHGEAAELHSKTNELDACHKAIYHDSKQECGHKLHISSSDKCSMCHLAIHSEHVLPQNLFTLSDADYKVSIPSLYSFIIDGAASDLSARAPPAV
jgi:hypothetical protein